MLQALRGCIEGAGKKIGDKIKDELTTTLKSLMESSEDSTRTTAAACMGTLCPCLGDAELTDVLINKLLGEKKWDCSSSFSKHVSMQ